MRRLDGMVFTALAALSLAAAGCRDAPGKPKPEPEVPRPDQVLDFATLYRQNCVACHGDNRQPGAAISLANPVYLAFAGEENLRDVTAKGVPGSLMPGFGKVSGGLLTDEQIDILVKGLTSNWGKPGMLDGQKPPPYRASSAGNAASGQAAFGVYCASCHGAKGEGNPGAHLGSIVDPPYVALISNQALRSITVAGMPGMPDWRSDKPGHPIADTEIADIVAWLASHRAANAPNPSAPATDAQSPETKARASAAKVKHEPSSIR